MGDAAHRADVLLEHAWSIRAADAPRCLRLSEEGLELSRSVGHRRGEGYALRNLGFCRYATSMYEAALEALLEGLSVGRALSDSALTRDCLNYLGATYASLGDFETAVERARETLELNVAMNDRAGVATGLNNIGLLEHYLGRHEDALRHHEESAALCRTLGDKGREALAVANAGIDLAGLGRFEEAVRAHREALALAVQTGNRDLETKVMINLSEAYGHLGRFDKALEVNALALELSRSAGHREGEAHCLMYAGDAHLGRGEIAAAAAALEAALGVAEEIGARSVACQVHKRLSEACERAGDLAGALRHLVAHHELERAVRGEETERRLRAYAIERGVEAARAEAELHRLRNVELAAALESLREADRQKGELLRALGDQARELERQAREDGLTGLANRRHLETTLAAEFARAKRSDGQLAVAMLDVDDFKRVNDDFSHEVGDAVLRAVAGLIRSSCRAYDLAARYGGEEFALVLPGISLEGAAAVCERVREAVERHPWSELHPGLKVTVSLGLCGDLTVANHEKLLSRADARLYEAKRGGKNRVCR